MGRVWKVASVMKTRLYVLAGAVLAGSLAPLLHAQYLAPRQYLRRLDPNAPSPRPANPPAPALPPGPVVTPPPALPASPAATNTNTRARAEQLEAQKRAVEALRKRAEAGSASAQYELGMRYLTGKGVATNLVEARKWFEAAARQGDYWAKKKLAELEAQGVLPAAAEAVVSTPAGANVPPTAGGEQRPESDETHPATPGSDGGVPGSSGSGAPGKKE